MKIELEQSDMREIAEKVLDLVRPLLSNNGKHDEEEIFTPETLAKYLKVNVSWVRKQVSYRTIPFTKVGKYVRFKKSIIDKWLKTQTSEPLSPIKLPRNYSMTT